MKIKIINLGRNKINKNATINTEKGLVNDSIEETLEGVAKHYLLSRNIEVDRVGNSDLFRVFAGFHLVGEIKITEK